MNPLAYLLVIATSAVAIGAQRPAATIPTTHDFDNPRKVGELIGVAERWTPEEVGRLAHFFKAEEYWMVETPVFFLGEGMARMDAKMVPIDEDGYTTVVGEVRDGVWVNVTDSNLFVAGPEGEPFEIPPGFVVAIGDTIPWDEAFAHSIAAPENLNAGETGCRVTCGDGFYACCNGAGCRCRASSASSRGCSSGGVGSTSCEKITSTDNTSLAI